MKRPCEDQADVLDPRGWLLSCDSIDSVDGSSSYGLVRGLFLAKCRCNSKERERQKEKDRAAEASRHGDSVADDVAMRQTFRLRLTGGMAKLARVR
jgi:hypothetical protein